LDLGEAAQHSLAAPDPILFATSFSAKKPRFFLFSRRGPAEEDEEGPGRDVLNERPVVDAAEASAAARKKTLPTLAVLHTTAGDVRIRLFPQLTPKTYENFAGHASSGYYEQLVFHRVIRGFMIQTGERVVGFDLSIVHTCFRKGIPRETGREESQSGGKSLRTSFIRSCGTIGPGW
jgi:hypothetical protein